MILKSAGARLGRVVGAPARNVAVLAAGAGAAQLVPVLLSPIMTRLYSPSAYGGLALFTSIVTILVTAASGRYSVAIVLPKSSHDAGGLAALSLVLAAVFSAVLTACGLVFYGPLTSVGVFASLGPWFLLIPLAVFLRSSAETLTYVSIREDRYKDVTRANITGTGTASVSQLGLGFAGLGLTGLMVGSFVSVLCTNAVLVLRGRRSVDFSRLRFGILVDLAKRYSKFPKYDILSSLANTLAYNATTLGLGIVYAKETVGHYALGYRLLALPSALIGVSLGQVVLREAARRLNDNSRLTGLYDKVALALAGLSIVPFTLVAIFSVDLFTTIFGERWEEAGHLAVALLPLVWIRFVASPLTNIYRVFDRQRAFLVFQVLLLAVVMTSFLCAHLLAWSAEQLLTVQSTGLGFLYLVQLFYGRLIVRRNDRALPVSSRA